MKQRWIAVAALLAGMVALSFLPMNSDEGDVERGERGPTMDLTSYSDAPLPGSTRILFIHHSIGGQLLAAEGEDDGRDHIYAHHPNGGDLRARLLENGYAVQEASYGSRIGERTDLFDWLPKMRDQMDVILRTARQDETLRDGQRNQIVMFKSCYPNSKFIGEGEEPGDPAGPEPTLANAMATMRALRDVFQRHPETLFVYVTAPAHAPRTRPEPLWKWVARRLMGRVFDPHMSGRIARRFNNWMKSPEGWLIDYPHRNIAVFDYFDVLTKHGVSNVSEYATDGGYDSHPSAEGNRAAVAEFVPFLNRAARRAGIVPE